MAAPSPTPRFVFLEAPRRQPWKDWCEWDQIHQALLREDAVAVRRAYTVVTQGGGAPTAVVTSLQLALLEGTRERAGGGHDDPSAALAMALVIVRAVNQLVDALQQGVYAASVAELADRIGLPRWLVDIRHDATHGTLPSMSTLLDASRTLKLWLLGRYWTQQAARLSDARALPRQLPPLPPPSSAASLAVFRLARGPGREGSPSDYAAAAVREGAAGLFAAASVRAELVSLVAEAADVHEDDASFVIWTHQRGALWQSVLVESAAGEPARNIRAALAEVARQVSTRDGPCGSLLRLACWLCSTACWRAEGVVATNRDANDASSNVVQWPEGALSPMAPLTVLLGLKEEGEAGGEADAGAYTIDAASGGLEFWAYTALAHHTAVIQGHGASGEAAAPVSASSLHLTTPDDMQLLQQLACAAVPHLPRFAVSRAPHADREQAGAGSDAAGRARGAGSLDLEELEALMNGLEEGIPTDFEGAGASDGRRGAGGGGLGSAAGAGAAWSTR